MIRNIEYDLRKLNSFILRAILIVVLIFIQFFNENIFSKWTYIFSLIAYILVLIFNLLLVKNSYKGFIRLILDLTVICVFLYQKDLNLILNYLPFLILLFNVQSHSNRNSRLVIFVCFLHLSILIID